jgi:hypothetical protein
MDESQAEIVKGVNVGDSVITGGNYELEDGMAVKLAGQGDKEEDDSKKDDEKKGEGK